MSEIEKSQLENFDYYDFIKTFFSYGEQENIVSPSMYTDASDDTLKGIISANRENIIASKELNERKKEKELSELDMGDIDNYIKRYLETSDASFIKDAVKRGMGVFVQCPKRYARQKRDLTDRLELLSREDLEEIGSFYREVRQNWDKYAIGTLREMFDKKIRIGKDGYSKQPNTINEEKMKEDIRNFLEKDLAHKILKKCLGVNYNGKVRLIENENEMASFLNDINRMKHLEFCKFVLNNNTQIQKIRNGLLLNQMRQLINEKNKYPNTRDLSEKEKEEALYLYQQMSIIAHTSAEGLSYIVRWDTDVDSMILLYAAKLWENEELRKKYYLPELDDLIISQVQDEYLEGAINEEYCPFEIKLKMLAKIKEFDIRNGRTVYLYNLLEDYEGESDTVNREQLTMTFEEILNEISDEEKVQLVKKCKQKNSSGFEWMRDALYSQLLQQLLKGDLSGEHKIITDEKEREYTLAIINSLQTYFDEQDEIFAKLKKLEYGLKSISIGQSMNKTAEVTIEDILKCIRGLEPSEMKKTLSELVKEKGGKVTLSADKGRI